MILAAGRSRRMRGRDKLMEPVAGQPLVQLQADRAIATGQPVFVTLPDLQHPRAVALQDRALTLVPVPDAAEGIGASLRTAMTALPLCDAVLINLADMVGIETEDLQRMLQARKDQPDALIWRGATAEGRPGHPILIDASLCPAFAALRGDTGGSAILQRHSDRTRLVPLVGDRAVLDLDTPEDWTAWRARQVDQAGT